MLYYTTLPESVVQTINWEFPGIPDGAAACHKQPSAAYQGRANTSVLWQLLSASELITDIYLRKSRSICSFTQKAQPLSGHNTGFVS